MEWYEAEVRALEQACRARALPSWPAVFYGSSSIRLWSTLARDLGDESAVNLGFGGSTLEACVWFFERLVLRSGRCRWSCTPATTTSGTGARRSKWRAGSSRCRPRCAAICRTSPWASSRSSRVRPAAALLDRTAAANAAIRRAIAAHPAAYYIDVFTPMLGSDGRPRAELFLDDGLHLSAAGYRVWAAILHTHRDRIFTTATGHGHTERLPSGGDGS